MKIIRTSDTPKVPEERPSPSVPAPVQRNPLEEDLKKDFEAWRTQVLTEFHQFQEIFEQARAQEAAHQLQNAAAVAKLTEEVQALRKTLAELPRSEPPTPPVSKTSVENPVVDETLPMPNHVLDALAGLSPEKPERKVAFLTKLWDYLNQVAFEIPLRKTDRIR